MLVLLGENGIAQVEQASLPGQSGLQEGQVKGAFEIHPFSASASVPQKTTPPFSSNAPGLEQAIEGPPEPAHVVDSRFLYVNVGYALAFAYDGGTTQWFLRNTRAHEVNPLFGRYPSTARLWGEGSALTAATIFGSYELRKHHSRFWWLPPAVGIAVHSFAGSHNLRLR